MRKVIVPVVLVVLASVALGLTAMQAWAQGGRPVLLGKPLVLNGGQTIPAQLTLLVPTASGGVTVTVPVTVSMNVEFRVDGAQLVAVAPRGAAVPAAVPAAAVPVAPRAAPGGVDGAGRPYTTESAGGLEFGAVSSTVREYDGSLRILGELTNRGTQPAQYVLLSATVYGKDGRLLEVAQGTLDLDPLAPGRTSPFDILTDARAADVGSYVLRVQP